MKRADAFVVCLTFIVFALWLTWPLARHIDEAVPGDLGDPLLNAWTIGWGADRLRHGLAGWWDAPIFFPYRRTLAFSEHLLGIVVPVAPIVWLTGRPLIAYNVAFLLSFVLAGFGMWMLVRRLTGRRDAALLGAAIFAFAPSRFAQLGHLQVLMCGWMPIALSALHAYIDSGAMRWLMLFAAAFVVQGLSNGYFVYFLAVPTVLLAVHALWVNARERRRIAGGLLLAGVAIVAALLPIATVYFDVRQTYGQRRTASDVDRFGADLGAYFNGSDALAPPVRVWQVLPSVDKPAGPEGQAFPGALALALGLGAFLVRQPMKHRGLYAGIGLAGLVLSLGIQPTAWGWPLPIGWVYRTLFSVLPGFDGLRVPARFSVIVLLALSVLAGLSFAHATNAWKGAARWGLSVAGCLFVLLEGAGGRMPLAMLSPDGRPDRAAYNWIRDQESGAVLELPAGELDRNLLSYQYEYQTLFHGHRVVNGASGYGSPLEAFLGGAGSPLLERGHFEDAVEMLRAIGVRTVVVRPDAFPDRALGSTVVDLFRPASVSEAMFPGLSVFRLSPPRGEAAKDARGTGSTRLIPASRYRVEASHGTDRLPRLSDGDSRTRWFSGSPQSGNEWIELRLDEPSDLAHVQFLMGPGTLGDYPRELAIDLIGPDGSSTTAFHGSVLTPLARGLIDDPRRGPLDIWLPPNRTNHIRLRQLATTQYWHWSVSELMLWERTRVAE